MAGAKSSDPLAGGGPCVSLVLPVYNSAATVARAIDSVVAQTLPDWELIAVDDGSTDGTARVLDACAASVGDRLMRVRTDNRGPGAARNTGIDLARGRYVAFLDADDELLPDRFARQVRFFEERPQLGLVFSDYAYVNAQGVRRASVFDDLAPFVRSIPSEPSGDDMHVCGPQLRDWMTSRYIVSTITGMVRREVLGADVRFPTDLRYCEEWLFFLEVCRRTRGGYIDAPLALHHHTPGSLSRTSVTRNLEHRVRALRRILAQASDASPAARRALREQIVMAHRQLGFDRYRIGDFPAAAGHFTRALCARPDARTAVHLLQAVLRSIRPGAADNTSLSG